MQMFETFLNSIPKNRSEMVSELDIPDIPLTPYTWADLDDSITTRSDSIFTYSDEVDVGTMSTDSSIPLSRAMTDSEIDYDMYRRYLNLRYSDPWLQMKVAMDNFPPGYLDSLTSFQTSPETIEEEIYKRDRRWYDELRLRMERSYEECCVFAPDDPGLEALQDALADIDITALEADLDSIVVP